MSNSPSLDPDDWDQFRKSAHSMLDRAIDKMQNAREGRVWTPPSQEFKSDLDTPCPAVGLGIEEAEKRLSAILPFGVGNTHPRFFGWVNGAGSPGNILAEIAGAALNVNLGGREHGAIHVEQQVLKWCKNIIGYPTDSSGLIVSGTSMATIIGLKTARDKTLNFESRKTGVCSSNLVGYASAQAHSCLSRAFDLLGLGSEALRKIPCTDDFRMDLDSLRETIQHDRSEGYLPFVVIGTAGSVNVGAIDDLNTIAEIAHRESLWFHVDGAFGATAVLSKKYAHLLTGIEHSDSLAFDFHKWLQVNYDAGCILIRSQKDHLKSFAGRPEYLSSVKRGLASGSPWPVDFGPELSRSFRALKIWSHFIEHGTDKLGGVITKNCDQARHLEARIEQSNLFELLTPVNLNIVCFRFVQEGISELDTLNEDIVIELQERGIAAPSTTRLNEKLAIRVNLTNHRTSHNDLDLLLAEAGKIGCELTGKQFT